MLIFKLVNFAILVGAILWAIKKFDLFSFLEKRKEKIADQINEAKELKAQAQNLKEKRKRQLEEAKQKREEIINKAQRIGRQVKQKLLAEAEEEAKRIQKEAHTIAEMEKMRFKEKLKREAIEEVTSATYQILEKEVSEKDHRRITESFLNELEDQRKKQRIYKR